MHAVLRRKDVELIPALHDHSIGYRRCTLVGGAPDSTHMALASCALTEGSIDTHVHSYEESIFVTSGELVLTTDGRAIRLSSGACGVFPVGVPHAIRTATEATWIEMAAPAPRLDDTVFLDGAPVGESEVVDLDVRDPRCRNFFLLSDDQMDVAVVTKGAAVDVPRVSSSMATALLVYSGIAVKMLIDGRLDAQLSTMFMVEYESGGVAQPHDHPFEEAYLILEGEVVAVADQERYVLAPGDAFWTGVGCIHAFYNESGARVRWLETQAPQPPPRHSYRFVRDWEYLRDRSAK